MGFTGICRSVEYLYIRYLLGGGGGVVEGERDGVKLFFLHAAQERVAGDGGGLLWACSAVTYLEGIEL